MHIEILTEDSSTQTLLDIVVPQLSEERFFYRIKSYRGIGRIPKDLKSKQDPSKRILLDQLPRVIKGYDKTPGIDEVLVVLDADNKSCIDLLSELKKMVADLGVNIPVVFRLAIEETEAWLLGDHEAIKAAYPNAKLQNASGYVQDGICQTWEKLADVVYPGGSAAVLQIGWPLPGELKHEWAIRIAPHLSFENNKSHSFQKLRSYFLKAGKSDQSQPSGDHAS